MLRRVAYSNSRLWCKGKRLKFHKEFKIRIKESFEKQCSSLKRKVLDEKLIYILKYKYPVGP